MVRLSYFLLRKVKLVSAAKIKIKNFHHQLFGVWAEYKRLMMVMVMVLWGRGAPNGKFFNLFFSSKN